jgi:hypothetical protein
MRYSQWSHQAAHIGFAGQGRVSAFNTSRPVLILWQNDRDFSFLQWYFSAITSRHCAKFVLVFRLWLT